MSVPMGSGSGVFSPVYFADAFPYDFRYSESEQRRYRPSQQIYKKTAFQ